MCTVGYVKSIFNQIRNKVRSAEERELVRSYLPVSLRTERGVEEVVEEIIKLAVTHAEMPIKVIGSV